MLPAEALTAFMARSEIMLSDNKEEYMSDEEFRLLRGLVLNEFGILIKGDKRLTFHTKVSQRLAILGLTTYAEYYNYILDDYSKEELFILASRITNNETYFFRERRQLDAFANILRDIRKRKILENRRDLKILSLACSSGEETYSLNIIVRESGHFGWNWDIRLVGIDIDKVALETAERACYSLNSFRGIEAGPQFRDKYFTLRSLETGKRYCLKTPYRAGIEFRHGNLLQAETYEDLRDSEVIFCRNMLIYMSDEAIGQTVRNFYDVLSDNGYLFIGTSESLIQKTDLFVPQYVDGAIVYRKNVKN